MSGTVQAESGYVDVKDGQLYYEVAGEGHPLLLIHAGVADSSMWDDQFGAFAQRYRVIRYDARGFGKTKLEDVEFSNRQDIYDLLKHLGVEKTYVLGLSRGGQIAVDFTLEHPEMVDALIAVAPGLSGHQYTPTDAEMETFNQMEEAWEKGDYARLSDMDVRLWADGPGQPEGRAESRVRERVREMCLYNYNTHKVEGKPQVLDPPGVGRLGAIHVPTLLIVGDLDTPGVLAAIDMLAQGIAGAKKVVIPETAHMLNMEKPEEFNRVVLDFLANLD